MEIKIFDTLPDDAMMIRETVFAKEQGFSEEVSEIDSNSIHAVLYLDGKPVATGRTFVEGDYYMIGRVAVLKEYRGQYLGKEIILKLEDIIKTKGNKIALSAQVHAIAFYEKLGYSPIGEQYLDEHCPHQKMVKTL